MTKHSLKKLDYLYSIVSAYYGVNEDLLRTSFKGRQLTIPKYMVAYLLCTYFGLTREQTARHLGRTAASVAASCSYAEKLLTKSVPVTADNEHNFPIAYEQLYTMLMRRYGAPTAKMDLS